MARFLAVAVVVLVGCGGVDTSPLFVPSVMVQGEAATDAGPDSDAEVDAAVVSVDANDAQVDAVPPADAGTDANPLCGPAACNALGANCGNYADPCGGYVNCGTCSNTETCTGPSESPGTCIPFMPGGG